MQQISINVNYLIEYEGKEYHVSYIDSTGQTLALINRNEWEIEDEEGNVVEGELFDRLKEFCEGSL
ncbi:MAG: hypothetical protein ACOCQ4_03250 [bacterium]